MKTFLLTTLLFIIHILAFSQPGKDGNFTVTSLNTQLNTYTPITANITAPTKTITVQNLSDLGTLNPGDLIMIYQAQGATINATNTSAYGTVTALNSAGLYEFAYVRNTSGTTIIRVECDLVNNYSTAGFAQVIKVPQYQTLTINSGTSIVPKLWGDVTGGRTGGVIAIVAENIVNNGTITASTFGFRGGIIFNGTMSSGATIYSDFVNNSDPNYAGEKGESIAGDRIQYDALYNGRNGRGAPANGGGGGNAHNAGGGGGANGDNGNTWTGMGVMCSACTGFSAWALDQAYIDNGNTRTNSSGGGRGGYTFSANDEDALVLGNSNASWGGDRRDNTGGYGGRPLTVVPNSRIFFGGGGGAGDGNNFSNNNGGSGGGIVYLIASNSISGSGTIQANGQNALPTVNSHNDAPGGGGGGGTIILRATTSISSTLTINANGGNGGSQLITNNEAEGPGGGGGGGVIAINTGTPTQTVAGGVNGTTTSNSLTEFPTNGATQGASGRLETVASPPTVCSVCVYPDEPTANNNTVAFDGGTKTASATLPGSAPVGSFVRYYSAQVGGSIVSAPSQSAVGTYTVWAATVAMPDSCESNRVSVTLEIFSPGCPSFDYARGIEILESQIPGTGALSNFPVLIDITNPDLRHIGYSGKIKNINGWDIRFTLNDGSTVLDHQIEFYDPVEGRIVIWVKVPSLSATANTMLYMFYGNSSIVANTSTTSVWSGNNYQTVYHMSENPFASSIIDHSGNGNSATPFNFTGDTRVVGKIGQAIRTFSTADQHFRVQDGSSNVPANLRFNGASAITISAWVRFNDLSGERPIIQKSWGDANNQIGYALGRNSGDVRNRISTSAANGSITFGPSPAFVTTKYYHLAVTYDGTNIRSYVDGVLANTTARTLGTGIISNASQALWIGRRSGANTSMAAFFDEIRIASDAKSTDWIQTEFNNQNDPSTFYFIYPEVSALSLCNNGVPSPVVNPEDFIFESRLCLDNIKVEGPSDFTDFPVLVSVQNNDLRTQAFGGQLLNPNGWDIGFRTENGTMADFEIESYNPQTGALIAWVKVPTLKTNVDTEIFLLYSNPNPVNDPSTSNTWSNGFRAVWHMKDNPFNDQIKDETGNNNTLVPFNFTSDRRVNGIIGQGIDLSAFSENYLQLGPTVVPAASNLKFTGEQNITLSAWVKFNNLLTVRGIIEKAWNTGTSHSWGIYRNSTAIRSRLNSSANGDINAGSSVNTTDYFYLSMTYDGSNVRTYRNGTLINTTGRTGNINNNANEILTIGRVFNTSDYLDAVIDETRIAGTTRSGDWLLTEYNNQSDPATFITCAFSPSPALPVTWLNFNAQAIDDKVLLNWKTASEINNSHFEIERSIDGFNFNYIGRVEGNGNKNTPSAFYFYDTKPMIGLNYYRLKQIDFNGDFEYSAIRQVKFESSVQFNLNVYPNPFNHSLQLKTNNDFIGEIKITDFSGRVIFERIIEEKTFRISLLHIQKGIYLLTHNRQKTYKIVKQ